MGSDIYVGLFMCNIFGHVYMSMRITRCLFMGFFVVRNMCGCLNWLFYVCSDRVKLASLLLETYFHMHTGSRF